MTEIDEVFVASTQSSPTTASRSRNSASLRLGVLDDRLDHQAAAGGVVEPGTATMRAAIGLRLGRVELALRGEAVERRGELRDGGGGGAFARVEQLHGVAGLGRHLGDAGAHDAGADDEDGRVAAEIRSHVGRSMER